MSNGIRTCGRKELYVPDCGSGSCVSDVRVDGYSVVDANGVANLDLLDDANFVYTQSVAASTWDVVHNLNKLPSILVIDTAGTVIQGEYEIVDSNHVILRFSAPFAGKAILN